MEFSLSEQQTAINDLAGSIFGDRATDEFMAAFSRNDDLFDATLWQTLADQGLLGITVSEEHGGAGLGLTELCLVLEQQARHVAPVPLYSSLVLGALPLSQFGSSAQQEHYLQPLVKGTMRVTAAIAEQGMTAASGGKVHYQAADNGYVLTGQLDVIPEGALAHAVLVPAYNDKDECSIFIVDMEASGAEMTALPSSRGAIEGRLTLQNVSLSNEAVLGEPGQGNVVIDWLMERAELAICAMMVGVCDEALKRTAAYTCERKQFNTPIGAFQAVAMQAADAFIDIEAIRSVYWLALYKLETGQDARAQIHCAKWWASDAGHRVVTRTQHLHGGMGADVEYPIHRFFLLGKHLGMMLGGRSIQLAKLGALLASDDSVGTEALYG